MPKKPKSRFVVNINGTLRELFSVREHEDGSLLLNSGTPKNWENSDGTLTEFKEQHYSIHKTKTRDTTITQKTTLADGSHHSNVAYLHNTDNFFLWPVYSRRVPLFLPATRVLKARTNDNVIELGTYNPECTNLLYSVWVARSNYKFDKLMISDINYRVARFSEFLVFVLPVFLNVPAIDQGDVVGFSTSPTVVNNIKSDDHFQISRGSILAINMLTIHWRLMNALRGRLLRRLERLYENDSVTMKMTNDLVQGFTFFPLTSHIRRCPMA